MREIKFRAKRIDNGEWVYGYLYKCDTFARIITAFAYTNEDGENDGLGQYYCEAYDVKIDTICQFTGLYDKKGKEIYENDLLIDCLDGDNIFKVIYEDGCFKFKTNWALKLDDPQNEYEARQQLMSKFKLACEKLGKLEDILEKHGIESLDTLEHFFKKGQLITSMIKDFAKEVCEYFTIQQKESINENT